MPKITRNFTAGKMNKDLDERLVSNGEYIDAQNVRVNSTETGDKGVIENALGNTIQTDIEFNGEKLSSNAVTIGAIADSARETIYWFIHDNNFGIGATSKLDLIVSYNTLTNNLRYHIVSIDDGGGGNTTLNFNPQYLITGVNLIDDLLFFTDDYNAPRMINIKRQYALPIANIDQFTNDEIAVIKAPPIVPLTITPLEVNNESTYMTERFLCFAYRYRYKDNQYSATTQFTDPIFIPSPFQFDISSFLNEGMVNRYNACIINYNTGGSDVVGIDLLYKEAANNVIRVIEKIDKAGNLPDNSIQSYSFSNQKIFTILPDSELLRLYDNVPRFAKAQTIMGNRIVYGNYVEGYDLIDDLGQPIKLDYEISLISEEAGIEDLVTQTDTSNYLFGGLTIANDTLAAIDMSSVATSLVEGAVLAFEFNFEHAFFNGSNVPTDKTGDTNIAFSFILPRNYSSVYELATSVEFQSAIGITGEIQPVTTACLGIRFTDQVNCLLPLSLNTFNITNSGIDVAGDPIRIFASPTSDVIGFQITATEYVDTITADSAFEYYKITSLSATFQTITNDGSLHSNRSYEVGIVYLDEKLRSTTALVSPNNNIFIPCRFSVNQNKIRVTIPPSQRPPAWAKYYKFAIKTDREFYETIYSNIFVKDTSTNVYCLIEGENTRKVENGDRLIVKADTNGTLNTCAYTTVLEKEAQQRDFLGNTIPSPSGVYIKFNANDFAAEIKEDSLVDFGTLEARSNESVLWTPKLDFPVLAYPTNLPDPSNPGQFIDYTVPAGSRIIMDFTFSRLGRGDGTGACERRIYIYQKTFISSAEYPSFEAWFNGDNVGNFLNDGISDVGDNSGDILNEFIPTTATVQANAISPELGKNFWRFFRDPATNQSLLLTSGTSRCSGTAYPDNKTKSTIQARIQVFRADQTLIWETEPQDTQPDIYFEGSQLFEIDNLRQHLGNVFNQNYAFNISAIIDTNFYNCYSFGNGVESYKIRDSISGKHFNLGNRVLSVAAQDYKEARRFADLTYSGVYNNETNVNKLNEFNLGLLNFKPLERSFGSVYILDGRETDIRVLQEDKISYVLAGKNLLSDAAAGGVIASIPEVLGTQIARIENYGISANPESYAKWGSEAYFTDAKRGAVLMLQGRSQSENLAVVSDSGMGTWFRSMFIEKFNTQKLGAYDPYSKEYVLVSNDKLIPIEQECLSCGQASTYPVTQGEDVLYCVNAQNTVGVVTVSYTIITATGDIEVSATYDGNTTTSGEVSTSGSFTFNKDDISENNVNIRLRSVTGSAVLQVVVSCPVPETLTVIQVCITNDADGGKYIHNEYRYVATPFVSPLQSTLVNFVTGSTNPLVSQYDTFTGAQGLGSIPTNGSTVSLISNKTGFDNFIFDPLQHRFNYLRTNTLYNNTPTDITSLLAAANLATPITGGGNTYQAQFTMPSSGDYLYLIWDYRTAYQIEMCYDATNSRGLCCCGCQP